MAATQIPIWSAIRGTCGSKSNPWRLHRGSNLAPTHRGMNTGPRGVFPRGVWHQGVGSGSFESRLRGGAYSYALAALNNSMVKAWQLMDVAIELNEQSSLPPSLPCKPSNSAPLLTLLSWRECATISPAAECLYRGAPVTPAQWFLWDCVLPK